MTESNVTVLDGGSTIVETQNGEIIIDGMTIHSKFTPLITNREVRVAQLPQWSALSMRGGYTAMDLLAHATKMASFLLANGAVVVNGQWMGDPIDADQIVNACGFLRKSLKHVRRACWRLGIITAWRGGPKGGHFLGDDWKYAASDLTRTAKTYWGWLDASHQNLDAFMAGGGTLLDLRDYVTDKEIEFNFHNYYEEMGIHDRPENPALPSGNG